MAFSSKSYIEEKRAYWAMVMPAFGIYLLVMAFPIVLSIVLSVSNYSGGKMFGGEKWGFAGFDAYLRVFRDPWFWNALKNNIYIVLILYLVNFRWDSSLLISSMPKSSKRLNSGKVYFMCPILFL